MPGSVANAAPSTVLPNSLCTAFTHARQYTVRDNTYKDGSNQRSLMGASSRKKWKLSKRLSPSAIVTLRSFYDARNGGHEAFYFYDPFDTSPKFGYDGTGAATTGRYTVHFIGEWSQSIGMGRGDCSLEMEELA